MSVRLSWPAIRALRSIRSIIETHHRVRAQRRNGSGLFRCTKYRLTIYRLPTRVLGYDRHRSSTDNAAFAYDTAGPADVGGGEISAWIVALVPLSALLAFLVVMMMASASASATGGCGGG